MFVVVYHYQIPIDDTIKYIMLEKQAVEFYLENGCTAVEIYRDAKEPSKWMEINRFESREHYERVSATLKDDPRISQLFEEFQELLGDLEYGPDKSQYFRIV